MGLTRTPALTLTLTPTPTLTLYLTYISPRGGLLYNVVDESTGEAPLTCNAVRADVFMPGGIKHEMHSSLATDGGKAWKQTLDGNPHSFEGIYKANQPLDVQECTAAADAAHKQAKAKLHGA